MTIQLILGDCLDYMSTIQDKSIDCIITDPPYGIGKNNIVPGSRTDRNSNGKNTEFDSFSWDDDRKTDEIKVLLNKGKNLVIFGGNYYTDILPLSRGWIVWDKVNSGNFSNFEMAWTSYDRASKMFRYMWNGMIKEKPEKRWHPTQKPVELMKWIILNYSKTDDTVFDPFMGSGTTGVACVQTNRNFIGIEIDKTYFDIAQKRIEQAQQQTVMNI